MNLATIKSDFNSIALGELTDSIYVVRRGNFNDNSIGENTRDFEIVKFLGTELLSCRRQPLTQRKTIDIGTLNTIPEEREVVYLGTQSALSGLLLHLTFNESDDYKTVAYDKSGNNYNATLTNFTDIDNARIGSRAGFGFAGNFNNYATNHGLISDTADLRLTGNFTICFWIYLLSLSGTPYIFDKYASDTGYKCWVAAANGNIVFQINSDNWFTSAESGIVINTWYHIAITRNDDNLKIYVNDADVESSDDPDSVNTGTTNLKIGNSQANDKKLTGYIDDFRMFDEVLTQAQIEEIRKREEYDVSYFDIRKGDRIINSKWYPETKDAGYKIVDNVGIQKGHLRVEIRRETV